MTANTSDNWNDILIEDWAGNVLFKGHFEDPKVDQVLDANRCDCDNEKCPICEGSGYSGDFEVSWVNPERTSIDNVYEFINY